MHIVDPHLHFFALDEGEYHWLKPNSAPFWPDKRDIALTTGEADLMVTAPRVLDGFVHIEAGFDNNLPWREVDWLEAHCQRPFRSVAGINLLSQEFASHLAQLGRRKSVIGVRHILDDDAVKILTHPLAHRHFTLLAQKGWRFDAQFNLCDVQSTRAVCDTAQKHPTLNIIVNHAGLGALAPQHAVWQASLRQLAAYPNIAFKLSGWEMADRHWSPERVTHIVDECCAVAGVSRIMMASNFPLSRWRYDYNAFWDTITDHISARNVQALCHDNACYWYALNV